MIINKSAKKIIVNYIIPFILIGGWVFFVFYRAFIIEHVFSIVTDSYSHTNLISAPQGEIMQGGKITGFFNANYDYLGILGFKTWNFYRINKDRIVFRIKEKGASDWHYVYEYNTDQFQPNNYFTFGFPIIPDSKGKTFEFDIESLHGQTGDAIGISTDDPVFIAKFQYPKNWVLSTPKTISYFALLKIHNLIKNSEFTSFIYIYLLPAILYLLYILGPGKTLTKSFGWQFRFAIAAVREFLYHNKIGTSHLLLASGIVADIFFVKNSDLTFSILIVMLLGIWKVYKRNYDEIFKFAMASLMVSILCYYLQDFQAAERSASWVWLFLVIWVIHTIFSTDKQVRHE